MTDWPENTVVSFSGELVQHIAGDDEGMSLLWAGPSIPFFPCLR